MKEKKDIPLFPIFWKFLMLTGWSVFTIGFLLFLHKIPSTDYYLISLLSLFFLIMGYFIIFCYAGIKIEGDNILILKYFWWQSLEKWNIREVSYFEWYGMGGHLVPWQLKIYINKGNLIKTYYIPMIPGDSGAEYYKRKIDLILHPEDEDKYKIKL